MVSLLLTMKAWLLKRVADLNIESAPLELAELPKPRPAAGEILIRVICCGVCHTELDEIEGRALPPSFPVVPGHQVVGQVEEVGLGASRFKVNERVGVAWIFSACGECEFCKSGRENLCANFRATGRDAPGGYAQYMTVDEKFAYAIPATLADAETAPLLCAGAIGYRSLRLAEIKNGDTLGLTGFGASGHLVLMLVKHLYPTSKVLVFARSVQEQDFARKLGAHWAGRVEDVPPLLCHAIIDTTPAWAPVVKSLLNLMPGGRLVINAIRKESADKSKVLELEYPSHLWMEKEIRSVANITRQDVEEFLELAARVPIRPEVELYVFEEANRALTDLKGIHVKGAKVLVVSA